MCNTKEQRKRCGEVKRDFGVENITLKARQIWSRWCGYIMEIDGWDIENRTERYPCNTKTSSEVGWMHQTWHNIIERSNAFSISLFCSKFTRTWMAILINADMNIQLLLFNKTCQYVQRYYGVDESPQWTMRYSVACVIYRPRRCIPVGYVNTKQC